MGISTLVPLSRHDTFELSAKVARLKQASTYPEHPREISAVETHMSWVFLTETHAYKLKKPVRYDYLDFSTLAERERNCREELRLNQRLAPGVYLAVVPLVADATGTLRIDGEGAVVEWLVKMRRLPAARMLPHLIQTAGVGADDIRQLAQVLVSFYRDCAPVTMNPVAYRARYATEIGTNRAVLSTPAFGLQAASVERVHETLLDNLDRLAHLFGRRVTEGRIIEGHGDLRPEHVCLEQPPIVFDRLEFNRRFRIVDPVDELSFLAMECHRLGAAFVEQLLFDEYVHATGDDAPRPLRDFYMAHRACVRARLAALHTAELKPEAWERWLRTAAEYVQLAAEHCRS